MFSHIQPEQPYYGPTDNFFKLAAIAEFVTRVRPSAGRRLACELYVDTSDNQVSLKSRTFRGDNLLRAYSNVSQLCLRPLIISGRSSNLTSSGVDGPRLYGWPPIT